MKSNERTLAPTAPVQRQAAAHAGASGASDTPRQLAQGAQIAQLAGGKKHHDPTKKKHLAKSVGKKQKDESARALAIKKASSSPMTNKEAKRQARAQG